jgi:hypothetical protein
MVHRASNAAKFLVKIQHSPLKTTILVHYFYAQ